MTIPTAGKRSKSWKGRVAKLAAGLFVILAVLATAQPASAAQATITGGQGIGGVVYWTTARTNTHNHNGVQFQDVGNSGGGLIQMALRSNPAAGSTWARASGVNGLGGWVTLKNDNGNLWQPAGTFYLSTSVTGGCGGSGCGTVTWSTQLKWDLIW